MTARGLLTLISGVLFVLTGRIFGLVEATAIGLLLIGLVLVSVLSVVMPRGRLTPARRLRPRRLTVGQATHVDLRLTQRGPLSSGILRLCDGTSDTSSVELYCTPVPARRTRQATYRFQPPRRGVTAVGPLEVERREPLGLARRRIASLDSSELIVHPTIVPIAAPPRPSAVDLVRSTTVPVRELRGEDFHGLRPYELGDDLRRVHWKATARHDDLMIREHDDSREGRTTVVADVRSVAVSPDALEQIVVAAASVLNAAASRGDEVALALTDGSGLFVSPDRRGLTPLFDVLARADLANGVTDLERLLAMLRTDQRGGTLVSLLGSGISDDLRSMLGAGFHHHLSLGFDGAVGPADSVDDFGERWATELSRHQRSQIRR